MKHKDFEIGMEFWTSTGQRWHCTDVGRRTITAIELEPSLDRAWFVGPPYAVPEHTFDEYGIKLAYRHEEEAIREALENADNSAHPGYPGEAVSEMTRAQLSKESRDYPRPRLFRIDRVDQKGEILHPYAAERAGDTWKIRVYLPFERSFSSLPEADFVQLRPAVEADLKRRTKERT